MSTSRVWWDNRKDKPNRRQGLKETKGLCSDFQKESSLVSSFGVMLWGNMIECVFSHVWRKYEDKPTSVQCLLQNLTEIIDARQRV